MNSLRLTVQIGVLALAPLLIAACENQVSGAQPDSTTPTAKNMIEPASLKSTEQEIVQQAWALLESRLGPNTAIELNEFANVVWPDGSMGCPRPGMAYTQALVDGYRIVLRSNNVLYHYHGRTGGAPFYCARPAQHSDIQQDR